MLATQLNQGGALSAKASSLTVTWGANTADGACLLIAVACYGGSDVAIGVPSGSGLWTRIGSQVNRLTNCSVSIFKRENAGIVIAGTVETVDLTATAGGASLPEYAEIFALEYGAGYTVSVNKTASGSTQTIDTGSCASLTASEIAFGIAANANAPFSADQAANTTGYTLLAEQHSTTSGTDRNTAGVFEKQLGSAGTSFQLTVPLTGGINRAWCAQAITLKSAVIPPPGTDDGTVHQWVFLEDGPNMSSAADEAALVALPGIDYATGQIGLPGTSDKFASQGGQMYNDGVFSLPYLKGTTYQPSSGSNPLGFPESWFAHSSTTQNSGTRVLAFGTSVYQMQPDSTANWTDTTGFLGVTNAVYAGFNAFRAREAVYAIQTLEAQYGAGFTAGGVWLDSLGSDQIHGQVNPSTGVAYTWTTWKPLAESTLTAVVAAVNAAGGSNIFPTTGCLFGEYAAQNFGTAESQSTISSRETTLGRTLAIDHHFYSAFGSPASDGLPEWDIANGRIPLLTISGKTNWNSNGKYAASLAGTNDHYFTAWANYVKGLGSTVFVRFWQEMNGHFMPWALDDTGTNPAPASYVALWQRVYNIFQTQGATNAVFVWCPNMTDFNIGASTWRDYYPGDAYVGAVGVDGYNKATSGRSFAKILHADGTSGGVYDDFAPSSASRWSGTTGKPIMVCEYGVPQNTAYAGGKPQWFTDELAYIKASAPDLKAIVYQDSYSDTQDDNRIDTTTTLDTANQAAHPNSYILGPGPTLTAYQSIASDSYFNPSMGNGGNYAVWANGLGTHAELATICHGGMIENFVTNDSTPPVIASSTAITDANVIADIQNALNAQVSGGGAQCLVKNYTASGSGMTAAEHAKWIRYTLACYYLANYSSCYFQYDSSSSVGCWAQPYKNDVTLSLNLGLPIDKQSDVTLYRKSTLQGGGYVYGREYNQGYVVLNTSRTNSITVTLPRDDYVDQDGNAIPQSYTVPAHTGALLTAPSAQGGSGTPTSIDAEWSGQTITVTTAGTRVQAPAYACSGVVIVADPANVGTGVYGGAQIQGTAPVKGFKLNPGQVSPRISVTNANKLYFDSSHSGDKFFLAIII